MKRREGAYDGGNRRAFGVLLRGGECHPEGGAGVGAGGALLHRGHRAQRFGGAEVGGEGVAHHRARGVRGVAGLPGAVPGARGAAGVLPDGAGERGGGD